MITLLLIRAINNTHIDDVSPGIPCPEIEKYNPDVLFIIPIHEGQKISENKEWCNKILTLNKTLALHGVTHKLNEFLTERNKEYLEQGIIEFEKCFGFKPIIFKAPYIKLNSNNSKIIKEDGMKISGRARQWTHKVYHCNDRGEPNYLIRIF